MLNGADNFSCLAFRQPGGNCLNDIRIDLPLSYQQQDKWLVSQEKVSVCRSPLHNFKNRFFYTIFKRLGLYDSMVRAGIIHDWFDDFSKYWTQCFGGRPISVSDFHHLAYDYRKRFHASSSKKWDSSEQHVANYQSPENLYLTFTFTIREAVNPIRNHQFLSLLKPNLKILEFGCSLAPMYNMWRRFASHKQCNWVLADIANYPFHYARHKYANDLEAETCLITEKLFDDPLRHVQGKFDIIIIQEVFEHLHKPMHIAQYLLSRLKKGGILIFDYVKSDAQGLDTTAGLEQREATLELLFSNLTPVGFAWPNIRESVGPCIGKN